MNFKEFLEKEKIEGIKSIKVEGSRESPNEDTEYNCWEALVEDSEGDFDIPFIIKTEESIPIKALGEFFFKELENVLAEWGAWIEVYNSKKRHSKVWKIEHGMNRIWQHKRITELKNKAIACLGESEVKKRLEEIK